MLYVGCSRYPHLPNLKFRGRTKLVKAGQTDKAGCEKRQLSRVVSSLERNQLLKKYATGPNVLEVRTDQTPSRVSLIEDSVVVNVKLAEAWHHRLLVDDESQDLVLAMFVLEYVNDFSAALTDWFRAVRIGGHLVIAVSHKEFQNRTISFTFPRHILPLRAYTSKMLLMELESSLDYKSYSLREFKEDDELYDRSLPPEQRARGIYDILMVLRKKVRK